MSADDEVKISKTDMEFQAGSDHAAKPEGLEMKEDPMITEIVSGMEGMIVKLQEEIKKRPKFNELGMPEEAWNLEGELRTLRALLTAKGIMKE